MMQRMIAVCLIILVVMVLFGGCNGTETGQNGAETVLVSPALEVIPPIQPEVTLLPDDLLEPIFYLNGVIYTLPMRLPELEANGWVAHEWYDWDGYEDTWRVIDVTEIMLERFRQREHLVLKYEEQVILVIVFNHTGEALPLREAMIIEISDTPWGAELVFPGNIREGSSYEDVIAVHGEPDWRWEWGEVEILSYLLPGGYSDMEFTIYSAEDIVAAMSMRIDYEMKGVIAEVATLGLPTAFLAYEAPSRLGAEWSSFTVRIDGALYQLPAPYTAFVENDWDMVGFDSIMRWLMPDDGLAASFQRGDYFFSAAFHNYDVVNRPMAHAWITWITIDFTRFALAIELPGGITEQSTIAEVIEAWGEPDEVETDEDFGIRIYRFGGEYMDSRVFNLYPSTVWNHSITIWIDSEMGEILQISIANIPESIS